MGRYITELQVINDMIDGEWMVTMVNPGLVKRALNEAERGQFLEYTIEKPWPTSRCILNHGALNGPWKTPGDLAGLVNLQKAIENCHRNSGFSH